MEKKPENKEMRYGLIGKNISYSFSAGYFKDKFTRLNLKNFYYQNFDIADIEELKNILKDNPNLRGFNVTIPYKEEIIPLLDSVDSEALKIGAVNTVKITNTGLKGYNTDCYGFETSLLSILKPWHTKALILGTGGASKAIAYVLNKNAIEYHFVSRKSTGASFTYKQLNTAIIKAHPIIINCTPLGTYPNVGEKPDIPYTGLTVKHLLYDLIYNPNETAFLKIGKKAGAVTSNGLQMLKLQAEKAWEIWRG
jgi:shikimate dehydrogenase